MHCNQNLGQHKYYDLVEGFNSMTFVAQLAPKG